jgi:hypothetical protein
MKTELRARLTGLATLETKHTDNKTWGWTWRTYFTDSIHGGGIGTTKAGEVSRYFGHFDSVNRTGVFSGCGYNKEDFSASSALMALSKTLPGLTNEQRQELATIAESFKGGVSYTAREVNKKAEEGAGSFWVDVIRIDNTSRGTYIGNYVHIYLIKN